MNESLNKKQELAIELVFETMEVVQEAMKIGDENAKIKWRLAKLWGYEQTAKMITARIYWWLQERSDGRNGYARYDGREKKCE